MELQKDIKEQDLEENQKKNEVANLEHLRVAKQYAQLNLRKTT